MSLNLCVRGYGPLNLWIPASTAGADEFTEAIACCTALQGLTLILFGAHPHTPLPPPHAAALLSSLHSLTQLQTLTLSHATSAPAAAAAALTALPNLHALRLNNLRLDAGGARVACAAMGTLRAVTALRLNGNDLGDAGGRELAAALRELAPRLRELAVADNSLGPGGGVRAAHALAAAHVLADLDISGNWVGDEGARALAAAATGRIPSPPPSPPLPFSPPYVSAGASSTARGHPMQTPGFVPFDAEGGPGAHGTRVHVQGLVDSPDSEHSSEPMEEVHEADASDAHMHASASAPGVSGNIAGGTNVQTSTNSAAGPTQAFLGLGMVALKRICMSRSGISASGADAIAAAVRELPSIQEVRLQEVSNPFNSARFRASLCAVKPDLRMHVFAAAERGPDAGLWR